VAVPEVFFDELFAPFYVQLGPGHHTPENFRPGQVFHATISFTGENRMYWRPVGYDSLTQTQASQFQVVGGASDLFRRRFPLYAPQLASDEEFPVIRAKRRPVILLSRPLGNLGAGASYRHHCVVLPRFGLIKGASGRPKYPPKTVSRMRALEFPDVFFTPLEAPHLDRDGALRLDLLQPVPSSDLEPTPLALSPDVMEVLFGQFRFRMFGEYGGRYAEVRELLLNP
jgi:hypothetical protein